MRFVILVSLTVLTLGFAGCGAEDPHPLADEAISKELFIEAYVQLRREGLRSPMMEISIDTRDRVLEEVGVTEEELFTFVEVWGSDGEFMVAVWDTIDSKMKQDRMLGRGGRAGDEVEEDPEEGSIDFRGVGGP